MKATKLESNRPMKNTSSKIIVFFTTFFSGLMAFILWIISIQPCYAQTSGKLIKEGNKQYQQKKYTEAEINYRKSLEKKDNPFIGNYNLGNTYYQQGKYEEAKQQYEIANGIKSTSKENLESNYHNLGNALLKNKKYEESIQAYKEALKLNPQDNDTRYNLAYAKAMIQQQQQQQKNDKNKDKNKDQDNKDKQQKDEKQKQDEQKKEQQEQKGEKGKQDDNKQAQQNPKDKISKEDAEKILQALNNEEKKTQKKLSVKEQTRIAIEKEW